MEISEKLNPPYPKTTPGRKMETAATCKYYVTKLLGISPPKPNRVYDVRSGHARDREQKSLFRVFYRSSSNDSKPHRRRRAPAVKRESYAPSAHADEVGAKIGDGDDGRGVLEDDTVEDIEKKFQGFRNVFEKCKVKKKNKPRLFNVSSGLRFTLVANSVLLDGPKKADDDAAAAQGPGPAAAATAAQGDEDDDDVTTTGRDDVTIMGRDDAAAAGRDDDEGAAEEAVERDEGGEDGQV